MTPDIENEVTLDPFHWHEALDRAHMCGMIVEEHLHRHLVIQQTPELREKVAKVMDILTEVYVDVARLDPFDNPTE